MRVRACCGEGGPRGAVGGAGVPGRGGPGAGGGESKVRQRLEEAIRDGREA